MQFERTLPKSSKILILGGGIHGVGVLHDLLSRGWSDVHLLEKERLGCGTSSRSTKLIHGGLRYLKNLSQIPMVHECLQERKLLLELAPDLVSPIEIFIPIYKNHPDQAWKIKIGLSLYDLLAGKKNIKKHRRISTQELEEINPLLETKDLYKVFTYWDAQTDDKLLVRRVAHSAVKLGARITEKCHVISLAKTSSSWLVKVKNKKGECHTIKTDYIVNCLGPWAHNISEDNIKIPKIKSMNNKGTHLLFKDLGLKHALLLASGIDNRLFFLTPWQNKTLLGTTEEDYFGDPTKVKAEQKEVDYLLKSINKYLKKPLEEKDIIEKFSGLRWLAQPKKKGLSQITREATIDEKIFSHGSILTLYGGKLTSYRALAEKIVDKVLKNFSYREKSRTKEKSMWIKPNT